MQLQHRAIIKPMSADEWRMALTNPESKIAKETSAAMMLAQDMAAYRLLLDIRFDDWSLAEKKQVESQVKAEAEYEASRVKEKAPASEKSKPTPEPMAIQSREQTKEGPGLFGQFWGLMFAAGTYLSAMMNSAPKQTVAVNPMSAVHPMSPLQVHSVFSPFANMGRRRVQLDNEEENRSRHRNSPACAA